MTIRSLRLAVLFEKYGLGLTFFIFCLVLSILSDRFLDVNNIINLLRQSSINGIIAVGMTLVILTAGIDLSVGAIMALSAVITAGLLTGGVPGLIASVMGLSIGAFFGLFNGILISYLSLPPFIATLGSMTFVRGLALSFTNGKSITGLPTGFRQLGTGLIGNIPVPVILAGLVFAAVATVLRLTTSGERLFALGSNSVAARFTGIPVRLYTTVVYGISGMLSALAGLILIGRLNSAQPVMGIGYEFDAIAAVVLGGASFSGGKVNIGGTLIGVLVISLINNGLNLLNVSSFWEQVVKGLVIALALLPRRAGNAL